MKLNHWVLSGILLGTTTPLLSSNILPAASADSYHAVEPGETLSAIASRYKTTPDALRNANQMPGTADGASLTAMLLRVPTVEAKASAPAAAPVMAASNIATAPGNQSGSIRMSENYAVQAGDTVDSIVARYAATGRSVNANDIRVRNQLTGQPLAGTFLVIPLKTVYATSQQSVAATSPAMSSQPAIHPTYNTSADASHAVMPVAQIIPSSQPVYTPPNQPAPKAAPRRGSVLGSRGISSGSDLNGVRVLGEHEEAEAPTSTDPRPKIITTAPTVSSSRVLASVAKVSGSSAKIRRLPSSDAASLYSCASGTELAVISEQSGWSSILMSDRSTGWIQTRHLRETGASVDITDQVKGDWTSRPTGSTKSYGNGRYSSSNPMVAQALSWLGTKYVYGGESRRGIDCSALVQNSFRACGYKLPRTAAEQSKVGQKVDPANLQPGDRLYFSASGRRVDHTGLYMGDGMYVHASGSGRRVMVSNLFDRSSWNIFVGARR